MANLPVSCAVMEASTGMAVPDTAPPCTSLTNEIKVVGDACCAYCMAKLNTNGERSELGLSQIE